MNNLENNEFVFINAQSMSNIYKGFKEAKIKFWDYVSSNKALMLKAPYQIEELNKGYFILNDANGQRVLNDLDGLINMVAVSKPQIENSPILFSKPQNTVFEAVKTEIVAPAMNNSLESKLVTDKEYTRLKGLKRLTGDQKISIALFELAHS